MSEELVTVVVTTVLIASVGCRESNLLLRWLARSISTTYISYNLELSFAGFETHRLRRIEKWY